MSVPFVTFPPAWGPGTSRSAQSWLSNASFAPAQTFASSEAKKLDEALLEEKSLPVAVAASEKVVVDLLPLTARAIVDARSAIVARESNPRSAFNLVLSCLDSEAGGHIVKLDDE